MKKVAFLTLGCKVNQYETQTMLESFVQYGYNVVDFTEHADVYVVNTCTVTSLGDKKSKQMLRRAKRKNIDAIVVAVGCSVEANSEAYQDMPEVDIAVGAHDKDKVVEYVKQFESRRSCIVSPTNSPRDWFNELQNSTIHTYGSHTRAFLKIQDGCKQFCSYCIIPYVRGSVRSKELANIASEAHDLAASGFVEIVLTGINVSMYGNDLGNVSLIDVINVIHDIPTIQRIRISSTEPVIMTDDFIATVATLPKLCPHYHISLQSGCDGVLRRMNRNYTTSEFKNIVSSLRAVIPYVSISTDIIVGFPGETAAEFQETLSFLEDVTLSFVHVFKYSRRMKTAAYYMPNQISPQLKEERSKILIKLAKKHALKFSESFIGHSMSVLFEQNCKHDDSLIEGLTPNYIRVVAKDTTPSLKDKVCNVQLAKLHNSGSLLGTI